MFCRKSLLHLYMQKNWREFKRTHTLIVKSRYHSSQCCGLTYQTSAGWMVAGQWADHLSQEPLLVMETSRGLMHPFSSVLYFAKTTTYIIGTKKEWGWWWWWLLSLMWYKMFGYISQVGLIPLQYVHQCQVFIKKWRIACALQSKEQIQLCGWLLPIWQRRPVAPFIRTEKQCQHICH